MSYTPESPTTECPTPECPTPERPAPESPTPKGPVPKCPTPECPTPECPSCIHAVACGLRVFEMDCFLLQCAVSVTFCGIVTKEVFGGEIGVRCVYWFVLLLFMEVCPCSVSLLFSDLSITYELRPSLT